MTVDFKTATIAFDPTLSYVTQEGSKTVVFSGPVRRADACLKGFTLSNKPGIPQPVRTCEVRIRDVAIDRNTVEVHVDFLVFGGAGGELSEGSVKVLVLAEVD